ncbi:MAG TPA: formimidoylglutamate deiminase [Actinomycetes bacterium]|nr:formimidoylglutamate deiminase [Actinomycetes bacterium]
MSEVFCCDYAWLPDGVHADVDIEVEAGRIVAVRPHDAAAPPNAHDQCGEGGGRGVAGLVLPGFANVHSHAFHRALRGRTHDGRGSFWTWRERMYAVAGRLDPDSYYALARATYAEMVLAGISCVGEFHYLHHQPGGAPYAEPNAMGEALRAAARDAGIRLTLLDTCYLAGGLDPEGHSPLTAPQRRFGDGDALRWAARVAALQPDATTKIGAAIHSVRAVPRDQLSDVVEAAEGRPLHVHLSEQPAENAAARAAYGLTPTQLLDEAGALGPETTVVHATHLERADVRRLGASRTAACFCPTTERDLADGIGPARALADAGASLCLGSDQHAVIDPLEEARALEMHERLASGERGRLTVEELVDALTWRGHAALGWVDAGRIEVGARADLVALRLDTARTAGSAPEQAVLAATAGNVDTVIVEGKVIVEAGRHVTLDVARELAAAITPLWQDA